MVKVGDICILDESVEYSTFSEKPFEVLVLWNGVNGQPLVTRTNEYRPFWTTYSQLVKVVGYIDLGEAVRRAREWSVTRHKNTDGFQKHPKNTCP